MNRLLLYCTKAKPYLVYHRDYCSLSPTEYIEYGYETRWEDKCMLEDVCNGTIVAECDFDVDEITNCGTSFMIMKYDDLQDNYKYTNEIARGSCLDYIDLRGYLGTNNGYAIHIKNLHIFDKPRELKEYYKDNFLQELNTSDTRVYKAPQNMMNVYDIKGNHYILISIQPQWLCKILNGEKTIEVRKKVLKEMLENETSI